MLVWANTHGAFIAGFVIWGIYLAAGFWEAWMSRQGFPTQVEETPLETQDGISSMQIQSPYLKNLLAGGLTSLAVTLLNPAGLHLWVTTFGFLRSRYLVGHTVEYLPPNFHQASTWPFLLMIVLSLLLLWSRGAHKATSSKETVVNILLLTTWTAMGLYSARNIPIYALLVAPILSEISGHNLKVRLELDWLVQFNQRLSAVESSLRGGAWPILGVIFISLALMGGARLDYDQQGNRYDPAIFPVQAVDWLEQNPPAGNGFNYFPWGGYLLYRSWPERKRSSSMGRPISTAKPSPVNTSRSSRYRGNGKASWTNTR
jgi:hypothetical protein